MGNALYQWFKKTLLILLNSFNMWHVYSRSKGRLNDKLLFPPSNTFFNLKLHLLLLQELKIAVEMSNVSLERHYNVLKYVATYDPEPGVPMS